MLFLDLQRVRQLLFMSCIRAEQWENGYQGLGALFVRLQGYNTSVLNQVGTQSAK